MSTTSPEQQAAPPAAPAPTTPPALAAPLAAPAQEPDWKAEARKWEARAKENSTAAKRLSEIEESSKSELQKAIERAEAAEKRAAGYESERQVAQWAAEIVKDSRVPADALRGSTKDELQAHFDILKALIPDADTAPKGAVAPYIPAGQESGTIQPKPGLDRLRAAYAAAPNTTRK